ncbi:hypothetical protein [Mesorhizobium sp. WSM3859]|uniref:hypothetical protein n=1 Tax=Mesorhizobium sp. WSM3859 TaxID=2029402 RepID=UPI0015965BB1|nr:hypothetical protein [Mesorhizobium sp. WSM3859]
MEATGDHITEAIDRADKLRAENEKIRAKVKAEADRARKLVEEVNELLQQSRNSS